MKIEYSKKSLKFLAKQEISAVKRIVLAWDSDYTKMTSDEAKSLEEARKDNYVDEEDIDWSNLSKYK